jgi:hypothetical protein
MEAALGGGVDVWPPPPDNVWAVNEDGRQRWFLNGTGPQTPWPGRDLAQQGAQ